MNELLCRLCAESELASEIIDFSSDAELKAEIVVKLTIFHGHQVNFTDKTLPEAVCSYCREILNVCFNFYNKVRRTQTVLRDMKQDNDFNVNFVVTTFPQVKNEPISDTENSNIEFETSCINLDHQVECTTEIKHEILIEQNDVKKDESEENPLKLKENTDTTDKLHYQTLNLQNNASNTLKDESNNEPDPLLTNILTTTNNVINHSSFINDKCLEWSKCLNNNMLTLTPPNELLTTNPGTDDKHTKKMFTCNKCHAILHSYLRLKQHKLIHTKRKRNLKCEECGKTFLRSYDLKAHVNGTHLIEPQVCLICKKVFRNKTKLKTHMKTHDEMRFECDLCHRTFKNKTQITVHMKRAHSDKAPFVCKFCEKGFKFKNALENHENVHKKARPFACTECGRKFKMWGNCDSHMKRIHGDLS